MHSDHPFGACYDRHTLTTTFIKMLGKILGFATLVTRPAQTHF